jgi:uncharacterized protein
MSVIDRILAFTSPAASLRRAIRLHERGRGADAFPLFARAAKAGISEAEYRVARSYLDGSGVPPSRTEATRWLKRAAAHGNVEAQVLLSVLYIQGWAVDTDDQDAGETSRLFAGETLTGPSFPSAEKWARKAAAAGSADGQALLGYVLTSGPEIMRDLDEAHQWYGTNAPPPGGVRKAISDWRSPWRDMHATARLGAALRSICAQPRPPD